MAYTAAAADRTDRCTFVIPTSAPVSAAAEHEVDGAALPVSASTAGANDSWAAGGFDSSATAIARFWVAACALTARHFRGVGWKVTLEFAA